MGGVRFSATVGPMDGVSLDTAGGLMNDVGLGATVGLVDGPRLSTTAGLMGGAGLNGTVRLLNGAKVDAAVGLIGIGLSEPGGLKSYMRRYGAQPLLYGAPCRRTSLPFRRCTSLLSCSAASLVDTVGLASCDKLGFAVMLMYTDRFGTAVGPGCGVELSEAVGLGVRLDDIVELIYVDRLS
jgi:hypothetical protein